MDKDSYIDISFYRVLSYFELIPVIRKNQDLILIKKIGW